jgi:ATPase subunit of ABC transporter with duplicated ATPase domains
MFHISHLSFSFDDQCIFDDTNFSVHYGDVVGVVGDNGSGKSTLLNLLRGSLSPSSGSIDIDHQRVGYVPQTIDEALNVKDILIQPSQTGK